MSKYVADYVGDLKVLGADKLGAQLNHSVLVLSAIAGTLGEKRGNGTTMVTALSDITTLSRLVGRVFPLVQRADSPPGPILVGRTADNDVAIADYSISIRHCYFVVGPGDLTLYDCGSTNGTRVNGIAALPRQGVELHGGEAIVLGRFAFNFFGPSGFMQYLAQQP